MATEEEIDKGRVIYSVGQVVVMERATVMLARYFQGVHNGRAVYGPNGCETPTIDEALGALSDLAGALHARTDVRIVMVPTPNASTDDRTALRASS